MSKDSRLEILRKAKVLVHEQVDASAALGDATYARLPNNNERAVIVVACHILEDAIDEVSEE